MKYKYYPAKAALTRTSLNGRYTPPGDLGCQTLESLKGDTSFKWDHLRTMRMGITGAFVLMPLSLTWNLYAERLAPGTSWRAVLTKLGFSLAVTPPMVRESETPSSQS